MADRVLSAASTRARWDALSPHYDRQLWLERSAVATAVGLLGAGPADRCLDLGAGTGAVIRELARRASRPATLDGLDLSPRMLARVGPLPPGWSVTVGDARAIPFADARFTAISASYLLHLLQPLELPTVLAECRRVLEPGGRLVTVTPAVPPRGAARAVTRAVARACDRLAARGPSATRGSGRSTRGPPSPARASPSPRPSGRRAAIRA